MNALVDFSNPYAIVGALFLLVVVVIAVWGLLRPKRRVVPPLEPSPSEAETEYLDSSHIISGPLVGRDGARVVREPPAAGKPGEHPKAKL